MVFDISPLGEIGGKGALALVPGMVLFGDSVPAGGAYETPLIFAKGDGTRVSYVFKEPVPTLQKGELVRIFGYNPEVNGDFFVDAVGSGGASFSVINTYEGTGQKLYKFWPRCQRANWQRVGFYAYAAALAGQPLPLLGNAAAGASSLMDMRYRVHTDVIPHRPSHVHILGGNNDYVAGRSLNQAMDDFTAIWQALDDRGITLIVGAVTPYKGAMHLWAWDFNARLQDFCKEKGLVFVDYYSALADLRGIGRPEFFSDTAHPNGAGHARMGEELVPVLQALGTGQSTLPATPTDGGLLGDPFFLRHREAAAPGISGVIPAVSTVVAEGEGTRIAVSLTQVDGASPAVAVLNCTLPVPGSSGTFSITLLPNFSADFACVFWAECLVTMENARNALSFSALTGYKVDGILIEGGAFVLSRDNNNFTNAHIRSQPFWIRPEQFLASMELKIIVKAQAADTFCKLRISRPAMRMAPVQKAGDIPPY